MGKTRETQMGEGEGHRREKERDTVVRKKEKKSGETEGNYVGATIGTRMLSIRVPFVCVC